MKKVSFVVPDMASNGYMIASLYPNIKYAIQNDRVVTTIGLAASFDYEWWNKPWEGDSDAIIEGLNGMSESEPEDDHESEVGTALKKYLKAYTLDEIMTTCKVQMKEYETCTNCPLERFCYGISRENFSPKDWDMGD